MLSGGVVTHRAVAAGACAAAAGRDVRGHGRLRQALRDLPGEVRQRGQFPRLSAHAGQRLRRPGVARVGRRLRLRSNCDRVRVGNDGRFDPREHEIVRAVARGWIGTPYHHQASVRGRRHRLPRPGARRLARALWHASRRCRRPITRDWAEAAGRETMLEAARRHLMEIEPDAAWPGDVLLFRCGRGRWPSTPAIMASAGDDDPRHGGRAGRRGALSPWWRRRIAGGFSFPGD